MATKQILITGGTGFVGTNLIPQLLDDGWDVQVLTRDKAAAEKTLPAAVACIESLDHAAEPRAIVNLAGENLADGRWTEARKQEMRESRLSITRDLVAFIEGCATKPQVLISGSAVGYYGARGAEVLDDPVRMYLREIGRVHLLTSKDERVLARKMEGGKHIFSLEEQIRGETGRPVPAWEASIALLERLVEATPLVAALGQRLGLTKKLTLSQITGHPELRAAIDVLLNPELMEQLAQDLNKDVEDIPKIVIQLSLDSWVLPTETTGALEDCTLIQLDKKLCSGKYHSKILHYYKQTC